MDAEYFLTAAHVDHFVYFVPHGIPNLVLGYDTMLDFDAGSARSVFDTTTLEPGALGFYGSAFDGRFIYFVPGPDGNGVVARFDAKSPPSMPAGYKGS